MSVKRKSALALLVATFAILTTLGGAYLSGYFYLGKLRVQLVTPPPGQRATEVKKFDRVYRHQWHSTLFGPAARVESVYRGHAVDTTYRDVNDFIRDEYDHSLR